MALNVNIIGKDSEGNLRALKVNSEGNLEISDKDFATESTLSIIKDNQGRLYGKYGEEWLPITVDSTGRLLLASDVTVNAEGLTVDLGQIKQGPAGTEPWPVQLSGTNTVLLSGFYDGNEHWTDWHNYYWGKEGTIGGNSNVPLDVRGYREIAVRITSDLKSQGVEQTIKYAVYAYTDLISRQSDFHAVDILVPLTELPYGATIYLTADKYPKLADPHLGILVHTVRTIFQDNDEGGTTVEIIGRV